MKNTNTIATALTLSDDDLLARLAALAGKEREALAELVAHLAALDTRPSVYAAKGYGSLFTYCTQALRLSEDAACNRIEAARACRRFPVILDMLASGDVTITSVRLLARHLTPENHAAVLEKAVGRNRREIEVLVAHLAPRADVPSSVRKVSAPLSLGSRLAPEAVSDAREPASPTGPPSVSLLASPRPIVQPTAPERYRVQFTIGQETHQKLQRLQALLRREIPDGDPGAIFDRAVTLLLAQVENRKLGLTAKPRSRTSIRPRTDTDIRTPVRESRDVPRAVRRAVWQRDRGQCAFVASSGRRCTERQFLEFHHLEAYAKQGRATIANISLRCRRHNQYEAELIFARARTSMVREGASVLP
jgi:5-methylcytosine-specific restriction endonuclease McrA